MCVCVCEPEWGLIAGSQLLHSEENQIMVIQSPEDGGGMSAQAICFRDGHFSPADLCLLSDARGRQNKVR